MNDRPSSPSFSPNVRLERLHDLVEEFRAEREANASLTIREFSERHADFRTELQQLLRLDDVLLTLAPAATLPTALTDNDIASRTLGDFRLLTELGRGGMGVVYEAEQISLGRRVALKVFPFAALLDTRQLERFKAESRTAAMLRHPNIVNVLSVGSERGVHYYAMELIHGHSLGTVINQISRANNLSFARPNDSRADLSVATTRASDSDETEPFAALSTCYSVDKHRYFAVVAELGKQVADALQFAHAQGVLHRDIKPSNLLLDESGSVHIADFGLARIGEGGSITATGDLVGTLRYMSPEQIEPDRIVDFRADIYALGATLYELFSSRPMYTAGDRTRLLREVLETNPIPLRQLDPQIPVDLETIVAKCTAKLPADRYVTAAQLAEDLQRYCDRRPIKATPTGVIQSARRWMLRNRRLTAVSLMAISLLLTLAITGPFIAVHQARLLHEQSQLAIQLADEKKTLQKERAQAEELLYDSRIRRALLESEQGSFASAGEVLNTYTESDLASFELSLLRSRLEKDRARTLAKHWCDIQRVAISPNDMLIAYGTWDGTVVVLDVTTHEEVIRFRLRQGLCWLASLQFTADGRYLFSAGDTVLQLRRVEDWSLIPFPESGPGDTSIRVATAAAFGVINGQGDASQTVLAVGDRSGYNVGNDAANLLLFHIDDHDEEEVTINRLATLDGMCGTVNDITFQPGSDILMACGRNMFIRRWQLPSGQALAPIKLGANKGNDGNPRFESITQLEFQPQQPDLLCFATAERYPDKTMSRVGMMGENGENPRLLATRFAGCRSMAFSPNGKKFAVGFDDGEVNLFDFDHTVQADREQPYSSSHFVAHPSKIHDLRFAHDGQAFFTAGADTTLKVWSVDSADGTRIQFPNVISELVFTTALDWLPDSRRFVSAQTTDHPMLKLWDRSNGSPLRTAAVPDQLHVTDLVAISETKIAFAAYAWPGSHGIARVGAWDTVTNNIQTLLESQGKSGRLAVSSDRKKLLAALGNEIAVIDLADGVVSKRRSRPATHALAAHPRRNVFASFEVVPRADKFGDAPSQIEHFVFVRDLANRDAGIKLPCALSLGRVVSLKFSNDGKMLAAGTMGGSILLWPDWETKQDGGQASLPQVLSGHGMHVWEVDFSNDNRRLASAALDNSVRLWNVATGNELLRIRTEAAWNYAVTFSPDGKSLAYAGGMGSPFGAIHFVDVEK